MTHDLKPYPAYKDSGVEWLGEVPEHWEVRKLRQVLRRHTERNRPDLPLLSVVREKGVILRDTTSKDENHNFIPDDLSNYKVVRAGQFVMNKMKAWQGSYGVSRQDGIVSPAYFVFNLSGLDDGFFHTAIRSQAYVPAFTRASDGVRIGQWDLAESRMREIHFMAPPLPEQAAIVHFLEHADRRIRRYIRAKQKLIKLLEEQKQAIIHQAVTGQIDVRTGEPYPAYKPSGVEWLGEVPEHWSELPLKRISRLENSGSYGVEPELGDHIMPVATTAQIDRDGNFAVGRMPQRGFSSSDLRRYRCHPGDILVVKSSGSIFNVISGKAGLVREDTPPFVFSNFLMRVVSDRSTVEPEYLFLLLGGHLTRERVKRMVAGTTYPNLRVGEYVSAVLPLPPLDDQRSIIAALASDTKAVDQAIDTASREAFLLREYRTRLIADVVTGKLDVREAATQLPDEPADAAEEGDEPLDDETDDLTEADEDAEAVMAAD